MVKTVKKILSHFSSNPSKNRPIMDSAPFISVDYWIVRSTFSITTTLPVSKVNRLFNDCPSCPVAFIKTDLVARYIDVLLKQTKPFILITASNDDQGVPDYLVDEHSVSCARVKEKTDQLLKEENLISWFTKNPSCIHPKLKPVPLGPKWQWRSTDFFGEDKTTHLAIFNKYLTIPHEKFKNTAEKTELVYFNFNEATTSNPFVKEHKNIRELIKQQCLRRFPWTADEPFERYIQHLSKYKFCLCPPGRGIDSHRTWEALLSGTIPIMMHTPLDVLFEKLPVLFVDDWNSITEEFLKTAYDELHKKTYDFSICYTPHWDTVLTNTAKLHRSLYTGNICAKSVFL